MEASASNISRGDVAPGPSVDELLREIDSYGAIPRKPTALADYGLAELAEDFGESAEDFDEGDFGESAGFGEDFGESAGFGNRKGSSYTDFASQYKRGFEVEDDASVADTCDSIHALTKAQAVTLRSLATQVAALSAEVAELTVLLRQIASAVSSPKQAP